MTFTLNKFIRFLPSASFVMAAEYLMGLAASVVCGHLIGPEGLAVVNLMQPLMGVVSFFALLVGVGTSVLYSVEMGKFNKRRSREILTQGLWTACIAGVLLFVAAAVFRESAADAFGVKGAVLAGFKEYWFWFLPCAFLEPVQFLFVSACYADGDGKICMWAYIGQLASNFVVSYILTFHFGFAGCGIGTSLGFVISLIILMAHFRKKTNSLGFVKHFSFVDTFKICKCSFGDASGKLCQAILFLVLNVYVISHFGEGMLPVLSLVVAVLGLSESFDGVSRAMQPLASVYIGEDNDRLTKRILDYSEVAVAAEGVVITIILAAFPSIILELVGMDAPELAVKGRLAVRIVSLGLVGTAFITLFNSYWTFKAKEMLAFVLTVVSMLACPLILFIPMGKIWGAVGLWSALAIAPYMSLAVMAVYISWKWGWNAFPAFLSRENMKNLRIYDIVLTPENICALSEKINKFLSIRRDFSKRNASLAALLLEESLMLVRDRNANCTIHAEISLRFTDHILLTIRDDGEIFNLTDADADISSMRAYMVSNLMLSLPARRNMTTTGFNRNAFRI